MTETLKSQIIAVLDAGKDMTIATLREDGYPQATTVSYASDGLAIYFGCGETSQKARNLARDDRVSLTIDLPYEHWNEIRSLSMGGRARRLTDPAEQAEGGALFMRKFSAEMAQYMSTAGGAALYRITPEVISLLNYRKGFGHCELARAADL
jgi:nitroimidazol reductase NimA-like FMN-containing flavoprotein (pyridoxamine 5'-phosphate oxidase superfamily)